MNKYQFHTASLLRTGVVALATLFCDVGLAAANDRTQSKDVVLVTPDASGAVGETGGAKPSLPHRATAAHTVFGVALGDLGLQVLRAPGLQTDAAGNALVSPFSVANALGLLHAGAGTGTAAEIAGVVMPAVTAERRLQMTLGSLNRQAGGISGGPGAEWITANRVWIDHGVVQAVRPAFVNQAQQTYQADGMRVDFSDPAKARATINDWAAQRSHGKIKSLLPDGGLAPNTKFVLTNAVYFKGRWATQFNPAYTRPEVFHNADGSKIAIPTMAGTLNAREGMLGRLQLIEVPYAHADFALLFAIPQDGIPLSALEPELGGVDLTEWQLALTPVRIDLRLPRFSIQPQTFSLKDVLQRAGMAQAFGPSANFEPMLGRSGVVLDNVYHAAGIDVDEQGSEAVASTAAIGRAKSVPPLETVPLRKIDRPFLFVLIHKPTHTPLFVGRISQFK